MALPKLIGARENMADEGSKIQYVDHHVDYASWITRVKHVILKRNADHLPCHIFQSLLNAKILMLHVGCSNALTFTWLNSYVEHTVITHLHVIQLFAKECMLGNPLWFRMSLVPTYLAITVVLDQSSVVLCFSRKFFSGYGTVRHLMVYCYCDKISHNHLESISQFLTQMTCPSRRKLLWKNELLWSKQMMQCRPSC